MTKDQRILNQVTAVNARADYLNQVAPLLIAQLATGYTLKNDGISFFAKDKKKLDAILNSVKKPAGLRARFEVRGSVMLACDINYMIDECSCMYTDDNVYLADVRNPTYLAEFHPRGHIRVQDITEAIQLHDELFKKTQELQVLMSAAKRMIES